MIIYTVYNYYMCVFFFKQKTAYEIKECDWSSDVCSSDLCVMSPHQSWQKELTAEQVRQKISAAADLGRIGPVYVIETLGRDRSGRVVKVKIGHSEGSFSILADKFRMIMGPNDIKSTNFKVKRMNNKFIFSGHGWGHGVGFCQWGAAGMAEKGYSAEQILKFYYPGSKITRVSDYIK